MPAVKFQVRGKNNPSKITVRLIIDKETDFRRTIPVSINPKYFNNKNGKVRQVAEFTDKINVQQQLDDFQNFLIKEYNGSLSNEPTFNSNWLRNKINDFFQLVKKTDDSFLLSHCDSYIHKLKIKRNNKTGGVGTSKATMTKYKTVRKKLGEYELQTGKRFRLDDIDLNFRDAFIDYLLETDKLGRNTTGRYIGCLKTILKDAKSNGLKVSQQIDEIKGFRVPANNITLSLKELKTIINTKFDDERMMVARDMLYMGCFLGQRGSDLWRIHKAKIEKKGKIEIITLTQVKTKKKVAIPILPPVIDVLEMRNGVFPKPFSENIDSCNAMFNKLIKKVCKEAGLTQDVFGSRTNPKTKRKEKGYYPKYELVTSHICRRTFATNFYAKMPTALIIRVTGHSTERDLLDYIEKPPIDFAEELARYFNEIEY